MHFVSAIMLCANKSDRTLICFLLVYSFRPLTLFDYTSFENLDYVQTLDSFKKIKYTFSLQSHIQVLVP